MPLVPILDEMSIDAEITAATAKIAKTTTTKNATAQEPRSGPRAALAALHRLQTRLLGLHALLRRLQPCLLRRLSGLLRCLLCCLSRLLRGLLSRIGESHEMSPLSGISKSGVTCRFTRLAPALSIP